MEFRGAGAAWAGRVAKRRALDKVPVSSKQFLHAALQSSPDRPHQHSGPRRRAAARASARAASGLPGRGGESAGRDHHAAAEKHRPAHQHQQRHPVALGAPARLDAPAGLLALVPAPGAALRQEAGQPGAGPAPAHPGGAAVERDRERRHGRCGGAGRGAKIARASARGTAFAPAQEARAAATAVRGGGCRTGPPETRRSRAQRLETPLRQAASAQGVANTVRPTSETDPAAWAGSNIFQAGSVSNRAISASNARRHWAASSSGSHKVICGTMVR